MRAIIALITCLMLLSSIGMGSAARAGESACCMDGVPMATASADGDGCTTAPVDCDKNCPHHGACHEHHIAATTDDTVTARPQRALNALAAAPIPRLVPVDLESSLRPPRA